MLEHIKEGDLVVFTDGSEAIVVGKTKRDEESMTLFFDRGVAGRHGGRKESGWVYMNNGLWNRTDIDNNKCNDIIKVIPCQE